MEEIEKLFRRPGKNYNDKNIESSPTTSKDEETMEKVNYRKASIHGLATISGEGPHDNLGYLHDEHCRQNFDDPDADSDDEIDPDSLPPVYVPI